MAVDIDKFIKSLEGPIAYKKLIEWLIKKGFKKELFYCDEYQIGYLYKSNRVFLKTWGDRLVTFKYFLDESIKLPQEATDDECIEIIKRLMEKYR